ncbi:uncharacterized protein M6D78_017104 [Vipera latastei]
MEFIPATDQPDIPRRKWDVSPYGTAELSEQPSLGFTHPTTAAFEPLSFLGAGQAAPFRPTAPPPPEDFWLDAAHLAEGQGPAPFLASPEAHKVPAEVEEHHPGGDETVFSGELSPPEAEQVVSTVSPAFEAALPTMEELTGFEPCLDRDLLPPEGIQAGFLETPGSKGLKFEDEDIIVLPAESCPRLEEAEEGGKKVLQGPKGEDRGHPEDPTPIMFPTHEVKVAPPCLSFDAREEDLTPFPSFRTEDLMGAPTQRGEKKGESEVVLASQMQEGTSQRSPAQEAGGPPFSPQLKADGPPLSPAQKADGPPFSPAQKADGPPFSPAQEADGPPFSPQLKADGPPFSPELKADGPPLSPAQEAGGPPFSPELKADGPPFSPQKAGGPPFSPQLKADGPPFSPQKAGGPPFSPQLKADGPPLSPAQKADGPPFSPAQKADGPPFSPAQEADGPPFSPAQKADGPPHSPLWKADTPPLSPTQPAEKGEGTSPFLAEPGIQSSSSLPGQVLEEDLQGPEKLDEKKQQPQQPSGAPEKLKEPTAGEAGEHLPDPAAESMGSGPGKTPPVGSPRSVVEEPTLVKAKDAAVHPVEPSAEPEGGPSASGRPLPKPADHHHHRRRFGHAKPVQATLADAPEEHLPGSPTPKSHVPHGDSFFVADFGSVGRPSPRSKRGSRKGDGPALEAVEASKELPPESWDPEASAALKKKKKKGKPKKGPPPRGADPWEDPFRSPPAPDLLREASKEVSWASGEVPGKPSLKLGLGGRQPDGPGRPSFPPLEIEEPSKFPSEPKPGERSQAKARTDNGSACQPESPKGELSEDQKKQPRSSSSPLPPPPPGAEEVRPAEKSVELASRTPPKASNVDGSAWETSSAAGQKVEIQTVDLLVAPDKVPPEFQGLGRKEEPVEKPKELEEVFKKESEAKRDLHLPADSNATVPTQEGTPLHQGGEDNSGVSGTPEESPRSQRSGFHSAQAPLVVEPTSDPAQPLFVGGGPVSFTGATEELLGVPVPELPTTLKLGHDQPKKRDSDGKSKKAKSIPEVKEEKIGWSKASAVVDLEGLGEIGWTTTNPEQTLSTSPGAREKPKKRSSMGKSRKSEERSSFRQPFFTTMEDHLASRQMFDPTQRRGEKEGADITVADGLKQTSPPFVPSGENIQGSPDGVDTLPSAFPFISEAPEKQTERRVLLESTVPGPDRNKGPPWASPPGGGEDLSFGWATGKTKKRSSDGRSKTSRRGPSAGPSLKPEKTLDERDGLVSSQKGDFVQEGPPKSQGLELPVAAQLFPVLLETTGGKEGEHVGLEELSTAGEKASPAKAEDLHETKETPPKGQEAHQDGGGEGPSKPHVLLPQVLEEVKKPEGDLQDLQVPKVSEMKAEPSSQRHQGVKIEEVPTSDGAKEETSEDLLKPPGQLPTELLVEEIFGGQKKGKSGPDLPTLEQSVPFLDTSETGRVLEAESKVKTKASRASREKKDGVSNLSGPQPLKKSTEKKSKKTSIVPPEETKEDVCREDPRRGGGSDFTLGEVEVIDENRNIQSFPPGRQLRWEEDLTNVFDPAGALEEATAQTQGPTCPFLQHSSKLADEGPFCLPQFLQDAKLGDQKIPEELQENLAKLEGRDVEASLVMKAGVDVRVKRKKSKRTTEGHDSVAETHHGSRLAEESRGAELGDPREGLGSPEMVEEKPKMAPGLAAEGRGGLAGGDEVPTETQALKGSEKDASTLPTATAVLGGGSSPPGTGAEDGGEAEPRPPDSSGSRWRTDNVPAEEVGNLLSAHDKDGPEMVPLLRPTDGEEEKKTGQLGETSQLPDGPSLRAEGGEPPASTSPAVADHAERGPPAEVKKESPARPPPPMKGYMRPTKSQGLPSPRDAAPERGRRRPGKAADGPLLPSRRDTGVCLRLRPPGTFQLCV